MTAELRRVATLESFIIDTFTYIDSDGHELPVSKPDQIGGAGTYVGSRIFLPASRLAMIVDCTATSLPVVMRNKLLSYGSDMWEFRIRTDGHGTTRAVNRYHDQLRVFAYLSVPLLLTPQSFAETRFNCPLPSWIHIVSYPARTVQTIKELASMSAQFESPCPGVLWEPEPECCVPENLEQIAQIVRHVDIISPNHSEAMTLFAIPQPSKENTVTVIEHLTLKLASMRPRAAAIIRAGALGCCYAMPSEIKGSSEGRAHWVPAYWAPGVDGCEGRVVDPTGAGNSFMGGLMAALDEGIVLSEAVVWASVAASFALEQEGLPNIEYVDGKELWNGDDPMLRVKILLQRTLKLGF